MKAGCLFSGGKDSTFAAYYAKKNYQLKYLISVKSKEDSPMFHYPNIELTKIQAKLIGVKHIFYESHNEKEKETEELKQVISKLDIDTIIVGAVASKYQRNRISKIAKELNLSLSKVWRILNEQKVFQNIHSKSGGYPTNENEGSNGGPE